MPITLRIPGQPETAPRTSVRGAGAPVDAAPVTDLLADVEVVHAYSLSPTARAQAAAVPAEVTVADDDIVEIEVDGFQLWTSAGKYAETVRAFRPEAVQAGGVLVDALPSGSATRGEGDRSASAVRILRLARARIEDELENPQTLKDFAQDFGFDLAERAGSWALAKATTWLIERRLKPREGLYTWTQATRPQQPGAADPVEATLEGIDPSLPILLFLHGTASNTLGSFGEFLASGAEDQLNELTGFFKERIYAFEHKTLSRSPIENAIAVARRLPAKANLYLISHSRGGMVGDLLCLGGLKPAQIAAVSRHGEFDEADKYDRELLGTLTLLLAEKQFKVERFARAACPARGTLLASENLDQFLSMVTYLLGLIPALKLSPIYEVIKRITLETVKRRWEPGLLPGLEAMTPSSPLVRLLNTVDESAGALGVIAGDIQGGGWLKRFGVFISDRMMYDNQDNDLVVNTDSMFRGASRVGGRYVFDQGSDVSHFNYFKNRRTRIQVSQWLTAKNVEILADFRPLEEGLIAPVPMTREAASRAAGNRPVAVLVPDLAGSDLHDDGMRLWRDYAALSKGGFARLADPGTTAVKTQSVLGEHYEPLRKFLSDTHDVEPFAYDWRLSATTGADALAATIDALLKATSQPVRIVAHGMGGLVVRQLALRQPRLWASICARKDARIVFLGTPHAGTFDAVELLLGTHPLVQQLALLDPKLGLKGVIEILQTFPGVLELLPADFLTPEAWRSFAEVRRRVASPDRNLLAAAKTVVDALATQAIDLSCTCNVAGTSPRTVYAIELRDRQVTLKITTEGDGRVTHQSARLKNGVTWYVDAAHGALAADRRGFAAILDLLQTGESRQLATTPPSGNRGGEQVRSTLPERVLYPTDRDLLVAAFGQAPRRDYDRAEDPTGFHVTVVHGDLTFARYPIVVGHYEDDTIIGPESAVDRLFDGALTTRYHLGLYPGPIGTYAAVFRHPTPLQKALQLPPGAIVVGLGRWGELTAGQIANIIRRGAIEYVLQLDTQSPSAGGGGRTGSKDVGLSVLLIGATASNISTEDSVAAILRGIAQANLELRRFVDRVHTRISQIEIIELYVDTAIEAARAARRLAPALGDELKVKIDAVPLLQRGRYGRVRWAGTRNLDAWRRWEINAERSPATRTELPRALRRWLDEAGKKADADPALLRALAGLALADPDRPPNDRLRFVSLSDRARAEVMMEQHQPALIERLIASSITNTSFNPEAARALFELMVPNDLKDGLGQLSNVVFVLDGDTATYPWELMTDGGDKPLCTRVRMVRQLKSATFRPHIRVTTSKTAYVVGDPAVTPPFTQLPGARKEAEAVIGKLKPRFEPFTVPAGATALQVLGGLFARPYRILHLAGHGDYRPATGEVRERSGMVLDNGVYLTAAEVRKMMQVPELVFLNCCFIGQVGPEAIETGIAYNRLAASISRELIEMGVRAVVAAGWAVRDDAALLFATSFYDEMLNGATFGRAMAEARNRTWQRFPDSNTWGAYQAYGDPDFRLDTAPGDRVPSIHVAHEELLERIDWMWKHARKLDLEDAYSRDAKPAEQARQDQIAELEALLKEVPPAWFNRSDVRVAVAEAYGELGAFAKAIEHFEFALDTGELDSKTTIKAAEQLLNFRTRQAAIDKDQDALRKAIDRLWAMQQVGPTSERYSLLGGAYKRLAALSDDREEARRAIRSAAEHYERAHKHETARGKFNHYPIVNMLALRALSREGLGEIDPLLRQAEMDARERFFNERGTKDVVFHAIAPADIAVVRAVASGTFDIDDQRRLDEIAAIAALFRETLQRVEASPRQINSVVNQLKTLSAFVEKLEGTPLNVEATLRRDALAALAAAIRDEAPAR